MKRDYLFPASFQKIGWILLLPALVLSGYALWHAFDFPFDALWSMKVFVLLGDLEGDIVSFTTLQNGVLDECSVVLLMLSLVLIVFSKEKDEDECIAQIRSRSLIWALLVANAIMLLATLFVFGAVYLYVMVVSMFLVLIIFVIKFRYELYKFRKSGNNEE